jgi:spermidine/putrescine-binding protein
MKIYRLIAVLAMVALLLPACAPKAKSTVMNLYGWSDYVPQELLDNFTAKYGIKVNYDTYSSNEEMLAKLQAGASGYDVVIPSDYTIAIMVKQGMLDTIDLSQIPNFKNIDKTFTNRDYEEQPD